MWKFLTLILFIGCIITIPLHISQAKRTDTLMVSGHQPIVSQPRWGMSFAAPIAHAISEDPLHLSKPHLLNGRLVYTFTVYKKEDIPSYLVVRNLRVANGQDESVRTYQVKRIVGDREHNSKYYIVFAPKFSPDGRYILFKYGNPYERTGSYHLYILDTNTDQLSLVTSRNLSYPLADWSPDGNYIAYVEGGDINGDAVQVIFDQEIYLGPLTLYTKNWRTGEEQFVIANDTLKGSFAWGPPHTLFYGVMAGEDLKLLQRYWETQRTAQTKRQDVDPSLAKAASMARPAIYEYSPESQQTKLCLKNAYRPLPSPDGQWLTFYGAEASTLKYPLPPDWTDNAGHMSLSVINLGGEDREVLSQQTGRYPSIFWGPRRKRLLVLQQRQSSPKESARVIQWDIETKRFRQVATLQSEDFKPFKSDNSRFIPITIAKDEDLLFVRFANITGRNPDNSLKVINFLCTVDINKSSTLKVATFSGEVGLDWYSESSSGIH